MKNIIIKQLRMIFLCLATENSNSRTQSKELKSARGSTDSKREKKIAKNNLRKKKRNK